MKTKTEFIERLDDLVFENRNKDYGAYVIRKSYSDNVNKAFFIALSVATLLAILPFINFFGSHPYVAGIPAIGKPLTPSDIPNILLNKLPEEVVQIAKHVRQNVVPTQVVTHNVEPVENVSLTATSTIAGDDGAVDHDLFPTEGEVGSTGSTGTGLTVGGTGGSGEFIAIGVTAVYDGGMEAMARFLTRSLRYPSKARREGTEGTVYVSFIVDTFGKVIRAEILKGISKECDEEAKRVVSLMPGWKAANQNGVPVMVKMVLPIKFSLGYN